MKFKIELSWSKIIALVILVMAFILDINADGNAVFMFTLPFAVVLITGKQLIDLNLLVEYFKSFKLLDEEEIKTKIAWFMGYIDNKLCIQSHSSYYNHSNEYNQAQNH